MKKTGFVLLSTGIFLAGWQLLAIEVNNPELIPGVPALIRSVGTLVASATFLQAAASTVLRGMAGMVFSLSAACLTALLFNRIKWLYELCRPLLALIRSIPVISFILLALIFLRPESIPILIAFLTMFPLLSENLTQGITRLKPGLAMMGKTFRLRKINYYTQIVYPQLKPFLFSGLASALGFGWRAIIMGEVLSQCASGIGTEMKKAQLFIDVPSLIGWTAIAVTISFIFDKALSGIAKKKIPFLYRKQQHANPAPPPAGIPCESGSHTIVRFRDVSKCYNGKFILRQLTLTLEKGKIYGIQAPSGTGKSTLLNLISGSIRPTSGTVEVNRSRGIACLFQEPELPEGLSAEENISLPLASCYSRQEAKQRAARFLRFTEMEPSGSHLPSELSSGQQQRVSLARALAYPAPLLLLDEPFKGLDQALTRRIILRLKELQHNSNQTIIFVTHQPEELALLADEELKIFNGTDRL